MRKSSIVDAELGSKHVSLQRVSIKANRDFKEGLDTLGKFFKWDKKFKIKKEIRILVKVLRRQG